MTLRIGDKAPLFTLPDQGGTPVDMAAHIGKKPVVLFFYPKDETPICTREACAFRDAYGALTAAGADLFGISVDGEESHKRFAEKNRLPYRILSDAKKEVRKLYDVPVTLGFMPGRVTYIIDAAGVIRGIFNSQIRAAAHAETALATLQQLAK